LGVCRRFTVFEVGNLESSMTGEFNGTSRTYL
jgi:hypothetical protein